jgi:rhodanese-related sulfurtransferase
MNTSELKQKLESHEDMLLLDIREPHELEETPMIPGAVNMPMGEVFVAASKGELPKEKKIVTVCRSGARCEIVNAALKPKGYDVDLLDGGMMAWNA